ncbi:MAG: SAM-dependent methyltransferase [Lachnospiraceae bacterium]|nr:SAM-dependent methyltransferase [Lachnospiraceae bacterium]
MEIREEIKNEIEQAIGQGISRIIISNKSDKSYEYKKVEMKIIRLKGKDMCQVSHYTDKQVFQENISIEQIASYLCKIFPDKLKQVNIFTNTKESSLKATKSGKLLKNSRIVASDVADKNARNLDKEHNRKKNYILQEGTVIPPLVDMGVFTKDGKVVASMYDKFKQINRFIELVDDVLKSHNKDTINIVDFGCGKSYLTFILYYYLVELKRKKVNIVGLDLKEDVIKKCNATAKKYGYDSLKFKLGDINGYKSDIPVDMVVTLHACDTATDYALYNAVNWNATYIMSVPCCQHEVNKSIASEKIAPMMKYGIIKERTAALATDALRGAMLESCGYKTQLLEFVDLAHSPKNILIRAVKANVSKDKKEKSLQEAKTMCAFFGVEPTIVRLLGKEE